MKKKICILLILLLSIVSMRANVVVSATLDSTTLLLGQQTDLHLQVSAERDEKVQFPVYGETLIPDIEIIDRTLIDTAVLADGRMQYDQYLTLTCFKDSLYSIPGAVFTVSGDTMRTNPVTLNVIQPFEMDTSIAITDIKPIQKAPIWWWGIIRWILLGLLIAGLAVGGYYLYRYIARRRGTIEDVPQEPERPAEEVALEKLDQIKEAKIWQAGKVKEYHTELTDVVREYIGSRFDIHSSEKTSDETLREVRPVLQEQPDLYQRLKQMLSLADLVKFAKWQATPDENESALRTAYDFVNQTTVKPQENDIS
ncbi:MAG: BatD family protein [Paludibacteraceae bacterium]|nr:BatD family protein [Paludibacteraceae bacterium]